MKRFYKEVSVAAAEDGYRILLDGRPVKTPARHMLAVPTGMLADAIAAEWVGQGDEVDPVAMPLLRLANTVIDGIALHRDETIAAILRFGDNDLLCYRAHQPPALAARQREGWDPLLAWAARHLGASLNVAEGMTHIDQPQAAQAALRRVVAAHDDYTLAGLHVIASITGSLVLGLSVVEGEIPGAHAFHLSRIDEAYQIEKWGEDAEAAGRTAALAHELDKAVELVALVR